MTHWNFLKKAILFLIVFSCVSWLLESNVKAAYTLGSNGGYHTISELETLLDDLRTNYPSIVSVKESIGTSTDGRDIWMVKVSDNPDTDESSTEEGLLYDSLIHGDERSGYAANLYFLVHLAENYGSDDAVTHLVDNREFFFIPMMNPDGYTAGTRKNTRAGGGVDLNRNFGPEAYWDYEDGGSSTSPSSSTYRGPSAFSEPESQAIRDFMIDHPDISAAFNYHSCSELFIYPYAYNGGYTADDDFFESWGSYVYDETYYLPGNTLDAIGYQTRGTMTDYMYDGDITSSGILAIEPEVGNCTTHSKAAAEDAIIPLAQTMLNPNLYLAWSVDSLIAVKNYEFSSESFTQGSTRTLDVTFENIGQQASSATTAQLTTTSGYITITDADTTLSSLAALNTTTISEAFSFTIANDAPVGAQATLTITTYQGSALMATKDIPIILNSANAFSTKFTNKTASYGLELGLNKYYNASWVDIDNDGDNDLFAHSAERFENIFMQNNGVGLTFTNATSTYNLGSYSDSTFMSSQWIDIDNDGDLDLYLTDLYNENVLLVNNGPNAAFSNETDTYGIGGSPAGRTSSWVDINNDGRIDLFIGGKAGTNDVLLQNNGSNTEFTDVTDTYGVGSTDGATTAAVWGDVDNDGDLDLYRVRSGTSNQLLINNGVGVSFTDSTSTYNVDPDNSHRSAWWVDIDNDGDLDLYTTQTASNVMYRNNGPNQAMTNVTATYGLADVDTYGVSGQWFDIDNDGDLDFYSTRTNIVNAMFLNNGPGKQFTDVTDTYDLSLPNHYKQRGGSVVDINGDGYLDVYNPNSWGKGILMVNPGGSNSYIDVRVLSGVDTVKGARIEVDFDGNGDFSTKGTVRTYLQDMDNGALFMSISSQPVHIGLGGINNCSIDIQVFLPNSDPEGAPDYSAMNVCGGQLIDFPPGIVAESRTFERASSKKSTRKGISDEEVTDQNIVRFTWHQSADVSHYKVYTREIASDTWNEKRLGSDDDSYEKYFPEGHYEWKVRAVHTDGDTTDTEEYSFMVDNSVEADLVVSHVNEKTPANGSAFVDVAESLRVRGTAEPDSEVTIAIKDPSGEQLFQKTLCTAEEDGTFACEDAAKIDSEYRIEVTAEDSAGNESNTVIFNLFIGQEPSITINESIPAVLSDSSQKVVEQAHVGEPENSEQEQKGENEDIITPQPNTSSQSLWGRIKNIYGKFLR